MDKEVKKVFTPKSMILLRSARKYSSYLVRASCTQKKKQQLSLSKVTNVVKFVLMLMRHPLSQAL